MKSPNILYNKFITSSKGLTNKEVDDRRLKYGFNKLPSAKQELILKTFIKQFASPLIYVLLIAAVISFILKERTDSYFIFGVLIFNALIGTIQEYSANKSANSLKKQIQSKIFVIRDGIKKQIDTINLVPGDLVLLEPGLKVPADIILIESNEIQVNESMLTGESLPVKKYFNIKLDSKIKTLQERTNELFAGTILTKGHGKGIVTNIGISTELGKIAKSINQHSEVKPPLLIKMEKFTLKLTIIMCFAILVIGTIALYQGMSVHDTFMIATGLAVAAIPEGLPIAITITLSIGMSRMAKKNVIIRHLAAVEALGSCTTIASDKTGTLTINELTATKILLTDSKEQDKFFTATILANEAVKEKRSFFGDAVDIALLKLAEQKQYSLEKTKDKFKTLHLIPYISENKYSASFNSYKNKKYCFIKGAPETLLNLCSNKNKKEIQEQIDSLSKEGLKVIGIAYKQFNTTKQTYSEKDLNKLTFLGLIGLSDPLRPEAKDAIEKCHQAGIEVLMVTGDNPKTAFSISKQLGLVKTLKQIFIGNEFKTSTLSKLKAKINSSKVFARIEPLQKLSIIKALIGNNKFVAVTGDGVNDGPALKHAHVGVAMGKNGTDIARENSDIIITDDNFASIVKGVEEGRIAYSNIRKIIFLLVSTGIAEIAMFILCMLAGLPMIFSAVQLLWLNVVTEGIQDISLAFERGEGDEMQQKPKSPDQPIFDKVMIKRIAISAIIMSLGVVGLYWYLLSLGFDIHYARNTAMVLMLLFENIQVINSKSEKHSLFKINLLNNPLVPIGIALAILAHVAAMYIPSISNILQLSPLSAMQWLYLIPIILVLSIGLEAEKFFRQKN